MVTRPMFITARTLLAEKCENLNKSNRSTAHLIYYYY